MRRSLEEYLNHNHHLDAVEKGNFFFFQTLPTRSPQPRVQLVLAVVFRPTPDDAVTHGFGDTAAGARIFLRHHLAIQGEHGFRKGRAVEIDSLADGLIDGVWTGE